MRRKHGTNPGHLQVSGIFSVVRLLYLRSGQSLATNYMLHRLTSNSWICLRSSFKCPALTSFCCHQRFQSHTLTLRKILYFPRNQTPLSWKLTAMSLRHATQLTIDPRKALLFLASYLLRAAEIITNGDNEQWSYMTYRNESTLSFHP
jgi:hypothetical protein